MKKSIVLTLGILLLILTNLNIKAQAPTSSDESKVTKQDEIGTPLLIKNARIVDVIREKVLYRSVLVEDGKVKKRYKNPPKNFGGKTLDINGRWIIPGLFDMHVHSSSNKTPKYRDMPPVKTENSAKVMLYAGLTGFLDLFGEEDYLFNLRERQDKGKFLGAEVFAAGPILTSPNGHGTQFVDTETRTVSSPAEARSVVQSLANKNPDVVKLVYNPRHASKTKKMESMDKTTMQAVITETKQMNLKTVVHIGTWEDTYEAVKAGATAITHVRPTPVPDSLVSLMKKKNTKWIPTLSVYTEAYRYFRNPEALQNPLLKDVTSVELRDAYRNIPQKIKKRAKKKGPAIEKKLLANFKKLTDNEITVLAGTDAGNAGVFQGFTLHRELELYVKAGMTPWETLRTATLNATDFLGFNSGIQTGDRADFVVLNSSPIQSISNTKDIYKVIYKGKVIDRKELLRETRLIDSKSEVSD